MLPIRLHPHLPYKVMLKRSRCCTASTARQRRRKLRRLPILLPTCTASKPWHPTMPTRLSSLPRWHKWWQPTLPLKHWKMVRFKQIKCWQFQTSAGKSKVRVCSSTPKFLSASAIWLRVQPSNRPTMPPLPLPKPLATALSTNSSNKWTKKPNAWAWSTPTSTTRPVFLLTAMFQPLATLPSWLPHSLMTIRNIILYLQTNLSNTIISSNPTAISCSIATAVSMV